MDNPFQPDSAPAPGTLPAAVPTRARRTGWTPQRQQDFITALAETGCVAEAARSVGLSPRSAYHLRARADAGIFRQAWDIALDYAIRNLTDAALGRAINGVARPVFYKGEQVGERRYYDERLTQFLLRYRDPVRYGAWRDGYEARRHPDGAGIVLAHALNILGDVNHGFDPPLDREGVEVPLEEGPLPESELAVDDEELAEKHPDWSPETRELKKAIDRAYPGRPAKAEDDEAHDWRDPLTALRPTRPGKDSGGFRVP